MANGRDVVRFENILIVGIVVALFVATNDTRFFSSSILYVAFGITALAFYKLGFFKTSIGIDANYIADTIFGFLVAAGIIIIGSTTNSFALFLPQLPQTLGRFATVFTYLIFAPVMENALFIGVLQPQLEEKVGLGYVPSVIVMGVIAAAYHATAYQLIGPSGEFASLALLSGGFIAATIVFSMFAFMTKYRNSQISGIVAHAALNAYLARRYLFAITAAGGF